MTRDGMDRQITRLIQENYASWGLTPPEEPAHTGQLWDRIHRDGLRAVRIRRIRRTCLYVAVNVLVLSFGSLLVSFLWDGSGVSAFKEGLTRDIRTHGDEISIEYRDDCPQESAELFELIHKEDAALADVRALDFFVPVPTALPEGMSFHEADIDYTRLGLADIMFSYRSQGDAHMLIFLHYGKRDMSLHTECDRIQSYEWDGIEVTHFIRDDAGTDTFIWHIGDYMIEVYAGIGIDEARALFDDINAQAYDDWKKGDW